jgi:hypothetical protein
MQSLLLHRFLMLSGEEIKARFKEAYAADWTQEGVLWRMRHVPRSSIALHQALPPRKELDLRGLLPID